MDGPDFGDLIDDALLDSDPAALADIMWGAQQVAWWSSQRSCYELDLLGECMHEYRHAVACMLDGRTVSHRAVTEICRGLLALGSECVFVQLHELCSTTDALDVADAFDELNGFDGFDGPGRDGSSMSQTNLNSELAEVIAAWHHHHHPATAARMSEIARRFARRLDQAGVVSFVALTADQPHGFVTAIGRGGRPPAIATSRFRRTTIRAIYRELRRLGRPVGDPTIDIDIDIDIAPRQRRYARPLHDDEIRLCRAVATANTLQRATVPRRAVAWAFAEAGATTGEIPRITLAALDDSHAPTTVRLPGTRDLLARTVTLTDWSQATVAGHLAQHRYQLDESITYRGVGGKPGSNSPLSRTCQQIVEILHAANVPLEPRITPASIRHWAGRAAFKDRATLNEVAAMLGLTSLDATAARIGLDWTLTGITLEASQ